MPENKSLTEAISQIENDPAKLLGLKIGPHNVQPVGQYIPKTEAASAPQLTFPGASSDKSYIIVTLDPDAPFPSFAPLSPILHWMQSGLKPNVDDSGSSTLKITDPFIADYLAPTPPPGSGPHRYVFLLYEEPAGFDAKMFAPEGGQDMGMWARVRFDLDAWVHEVGAGAIVAGNYFMSN